MTSTWRRLTALLALLCLTAAVVGCSDDDDPPAAADDETPAAPEGGEADPDGVVTMAYDLVSAARAGGLTWDPAANTSSIPDEGLYYLVYGLLLRPAPDGALVPDLAESATIVDDGTIEVSLRPGQTFADGQAFDAAAVKAGLDRTLGDPERAGFADDFFKLTVVEVVDDLTVRLRIAGGAAASWHDTFLGSWETTIVAPGLTDFTKPVGAGPFAVAEFVPQQRVVLEKRSEYWEAESILVGGVTFVHAPDALTQLNAIRAGQADVATIDPEAANGVSGAIETLSRPDPNTMMTLQLCKRDGPLANPDFRRALNMAVDRDALDEAVFNGQFVPALGLWPEGHRYHDPANEDLVAYDPDGARALLAEAGLEGASFDLYVLDGGGMPTAAEVLQQQFADVGVTMELVPSANYVSDFLVAQKSGAGAVPTASPDRLKLLQWSGDTLGNTCRYDDPELVALQGELGAVSDTSDEAVELWHRLEALVLEDALSVFLLFGSQVTAYDSDRIGGWAPLPYTLTAPDVRQTYVKR